MKFIVFFPYSSIDWSAVGSMLGAIAASITCFFAIIIADRQNKLTKEISNKQTQQTELQIRIELFDKRYKVYQCLLKYYNFGKLLSYEQTNLNGLTQIDVIVNSIFPKTYIENNASSSIPLQKVNELLQKTSYMKEEVDTISMIYLVYPNFHEGEKIVTYVSKMLQYSLIGFDKNKVNELKELYDFITNKNILDILK